MDPDKFRSRRWPFEPEWGAWGIGKSVRVAPLHLHNDYATQAFQQEEHPRPERSGVKGPRFISILVGL